MRSMILDLVMFHLILVCILTCSFERWVHGGDVDQLPISYHVLRMISWVGFAYVSYNIYIRAMNGDFYG